MYQFIMPNVSKEGNIYRVRYQKNGKRVSKFFQTKKDAINFRKKALG
jgi:hypothetical protein